MNFFDNITTTATMRPPRMGVNAYNNSYKRPNNNYNSNNYNPNLRKPNSCATEHANSYSSSSGYFSANDTKSSCEESMHEKPCEKRMSVFDQINAEKMSGNSMKPINSAGSSAKADTEEKEPEWFSVPATLEDFIDLHGFEDDDGTKEPNVDAKQPTDPPKYQQNRRNSYPNVPFIPRYQQNNSYNNNRNMNYKQNNHSFQNNQQPAAQHNPNNNNQRFRNPLHFNKPPPRSANPPMVNPFFDAWRNGKFLNQQNVSFSDLMAPQPTYPKNLPPTAMHMSEVENRMKQQQNVHGVSQIAPPAAVPQFFQNLASTWGVRVNNDIPPNNFYQQRMAGPQQVNDGYKIPTQEQLHHFTSEIMRNAILRKNSQQYHDETNNYQK